MKRTLEERVTELEQFVFETMVKGIEVLAMGQEACDDVVRSGHGLLDFEVRMLLLAALRHRPLKDIVHLSTRELVPLLMKDLDEHASR